MDDWIFDRTLNNSGDIQMLEELVDDLIA